MFDAGGYRTARYRAPVDRDPAPARRIAQDQALRLVPGRDALFIDVLPVESGWRDPQNGVWRLAEPHGSIPGALWHPETGRGAPDPRLWAALREAVARVRAQHPDWPVVLFCRADCWMGWNAARRLANEGVTQVYWYGEGIDGWHAAGHVLSPVSPVLVRPQGAAAGSEK
ncbi:rhodanese-like domain-containing protein [Novosphingobium organovorum]|uniref:rhodanese-like domain-containing protein n=1 Tax=Novosphingobium organovorum TaxID=2930092 RepID=UPI001FB9F51A|nr:rhodanese-like domain-containing protein [Novosphingobium organovorum]